MEQISPKEKILSIVAAISTAGTVGIALGLGFQLISYYMIERGFSAELIGYNGTVGGIATILGAMSAAYLALRFGVVPTILVMLLTGSLSFLGFYFFSAISMWFLLRFILHFSMTILFVLSEFWINQSAPAHKRGVILSIYSIIFGLGFTVGPALLTLIGWHGFRPFGFGLILIFIASIPTMFAWKLNPKFHHHQSAPFRRYIFLAPTSTMAAFVYGAIQTGALALLTKFSLAIGYSVNEAAIFVTIITFGSAVLIIPIGFLNDYIKNKNYLLLFGGLFGFLGTALLPFIAENRLLFSCLLFVLGGIVAGLYTVGLVKLGVRFKGQELASANSAFAFCYGTGMLIGPAIMGKAIGLFYPYGFAMAIAAFFGCYFLLVAYKIIQSKITG